MEKYNTWEECVKWVGLHTIFSSHNDWETLRSFVLSFYKESDNVDGELDEIKDVYFQWKESNPLSDVTKHRDPLIIEFETLLLGL